MESKKDKYPGLEKYVDLFAQFEAITPEQAQEFIDGGQETRIFVGRVSCPYCRKFVRKLLKVKDAHDLTIYLLDTDDENYKETTESFRENYKIETVPGLIYAKDGQAEVRMDSSMKPDEIEDFLKVDA